MQARATESVLLAVRCPWALVARAPTRVTITIKRKMIMSTAYLLYLYFPSKPLTKERSAYDFDRRDHFNVCLRRHSLAHLCRHLLPPITVLLSSHYLA